MPPKRLDPRAIVDLCDVVETNISEKVRLDFRFEIELIKNEIMRSIVVVLRNVSTKDGYEESTEDFKFFRSSGEEKIVRMERLIEYRYG